jgi:cyclopropane fatty-acyl-phospholipid synthase-like methyltransferase
MYDFSERNLFDIITILKEKLQILKSHETIKFKVLNPDFSPTTYNGNTVKVDDRELIHRSYKTWVDLAQQLQCEMQTPLLFSDSIVVITFRKLSSDDSFHKQIVDKEEKYGEQSIFSQIHKNEEASFLYYYIQALQNVHVDKRVEILNLGVNSGDEFEVIKKISKDFQALELTGIDYCSSAIKNAKEKFKEDKNVTFIQYDINELDSLAFERFDLIISIGTLQSSNLEFNKLLMSVVQNQLKRSGAIILGFPNCRWIDGEMIYGAKVKNYAFSELGLLYKDAIFAKKYLQQKKFRVTLTGKDYIFLTATALQKDIITK